MSTVGHATRRRWVAVAAGVAALAAATVVAPEVLRVADAAVNSRDAVEPRALVDRALASADVPYWGVAESRGSLGLPDLPRLSGVPALLGGTTKLRVWWSSDTAWRVDTLTPTGETGTYGVGLNAVVWDFESSELTTVIGADGVRLPRADDLLPPQAARRLLAALGPGDEVTGLPDRWVAGRTAAGVRVVPGDARSTVSHVDLWVEPSTGLPLDLHVAAADGLDALRSTFHDVSLGAPDPDVLAPPSPALADRDVTTTPDLAAYVNQRAPWRLPDELAGLPASGPVQGTATYGAGMVRFAVLPLPPDLARDMVDSAADAGAAAVELPGGEALLVTTSVLNALLVQGPDGHAYVIAGSVTPQTLTDAGRELLADPPPRRVP